MAADFHGWCREEGFYVATVNGFPYGTFHHTPVKESVYLPDWRFAERVQYTRKLAELLGYLAAGRDAGFYLNGTGRFSSCIGKEDMATVSKNLQAALDFMDHLAQTTGKEIVLAMEPEPGCFLETTADVVDFFTGMPLSPRQRQGLAVCYDCCHQALQFENPAASLQMLADNDIQNRSCAGVFGLTS